MCIAQPHVVAASQTAPAPTRSSVSVQSAADRLSLVNENRNTVAKRQGIFGNIKTTPLGDASYGTSAVAKFG